MHGPRESGASAAVMAGDRGEGWFFSGAYVSQHPAEGGVFVRLVQIHGHGLVRTVYTSE